MRRAALFGSAMARYLTQTAVPGKLDQFGELLGQVARGKVRLYPGDDVGVKTEPDLEVVGDFEVLPLDMIRVTMRTDEMASSISDKPWEKIVNEMAEAPVPMDVGLRDAVDVFSWAGIKYCLPDAEMHGMLWCLHYRVITPPG